MPKSKNPESYPYGYRELVEAVDKSGVPITLNFPTKEEANRVRFDLYGFKGALLHSQDELAVPASRLIMKVELRVEDMSYDLKCYSALDADINGKIAEAITGVHKAGAPSGDTTPQNQLPLPEVLQEQLGDPDPADHDVLLQRMYGAGSTSPTSPGSTRAEPADAGGEEEKG